MVARKTVAKIAVGGFASFVLGGLVLAYQPHSRILPKEYGLEQKTYELNIMREFEQWNQRLEEAQVEHPFRVGMYKNVNRAMGLGLLSGFLTMLFGGIAWIHYPTEEEQKRDRGYDGVERRRFPMYDVNIPVIGEIIPVDDSKEENKYDIN